MLRIVFYLMERESKMAEKMQLTHQDIFELCKELAMRVDAVRRVRGIKRPKVYAIPRGGIPVLYVLHTRLNIVIVNDPKEADIFIDDISDSGETMRRYLSINPDASFIALIDKINSERHRQEFGGRWIVFPWERGENHEDDSFESNITRLLEYIGEDPNREGLKETPKRVAKAWEHWCGGYALKPEHILKTFSDGAERHDQMVVVRDIPFYSHCEHHLAPFFGTATVAYIPNGLIVGLSKLSRLVDMYARRLQVQERMTDQIADALNQHLKPLGVGVRIKARHLCMESRGICQQGHHTVTTALRGVMKTNPEARSEFLDSAE